MALVDAKSFPVAVEELDLFSVPPTQVAIMGSSELTVFPKNPVESNGPVIFEMPPQPYFTDVGNHKLIMRYKVTRSDGSNLLTTPGSEDKVAPVCNIINTAWAHAKLFSGGKLLWDSGDKYHLKAYVQTVLGFGRLAKQTFLATGGYVEDTPGHMDSPTDANRGFTVRRQSHAASVVREAIGFLFVDPWMQGKLWPPNIPLRLELFRNADDVTLHYVDGGVSFRLKLLDVRLVTRMVHAVPSLTIALEKQLSRSACKFPIRRTELRTLHLEHNRREVVQTQIYSGVLPRRAIVFFLDNEAFYGSKSTSGFNFAHFDVKKIQMICGGKEFPEQAYELDFDTGQYAHAYYDLHRCVRAEDGTPCDLTPAAFADGYTMIAFDLSQDCSGSGDHYNVSRNGNLELRMQFGRAITNANGVECMILLEFDSCITMDFNRNFYLDYSI